MESVGAAVGGGVVASLSTRSLSDRAQLVLSNLIDGASVGTGVISSTIASTSSGSVSLIGSLGLSGSSSSRLLSCLRGSGRSSGCGSTVSSLGPGSNVINLHGGIGPCVCLRQLEIGISSKESSSDGKIENEVESSVPWLSLSPIRSIGSGIPPSLSVIGLEDVSVQKPCQRCGGPFQSIDMEIFRQIGAISVVSSGGPYIVGPCSSVVKGSRD